MTVSASGTREQEPAVSSEVPEFSVAAKVVRGVKKIIPRVVLATGAALGGAACGSKPADLPPAPTPIIEPVAPDLRPTLPASREITVIPALPTATVETESLKAIPVSFQEKATVEAERAKQVYDRLRSVDLPDQNKVEALVFVYTDDKGKVHINVGTLGEKKQLGVFNLKTGGIKWTEEEVTAPDGTKGRRFIDSKTGLIVYWEGEEKGKPIGRPVAQINQQTGEVVFNPVFDQKSPTASRTIVPSETATTTATAASSTATATETPTATRTATASPTQTETATATGTASKTTTASRTPTATATETKRPDTATPAPANTPTPTPSPTQETQPGGGEIYESEKHGTRIEIHNDARLRVFPQKKNLDELLALIREFGKRSIVIYNKPSFAGVDNDENGNFVARGQTICGSQSRGCIYYRTAFDSATGELKIFMYVRGLETIVYLGPNKQQFNTVNDTLVGHIIHPGDPGRERAEKFYFSGPDGWLFNTQLISP